MPRKATATPEFKESKVNALVVQEGRDALQAVAFENAQNAGLTNAQADEVFASGADIGRLEAMDFMRTVSESAILSIYENVKKSKAYKHLRNPESAHGAHFDSLEDFCRIKLGKSYARMRELLLNKNTVGLAAFEQAGRIGIQQRDFDAIKALPAPDQELVRRALEDATSREEVLELMQELASNAAAAQQELAAEVENQKGEVVAWQETAAKNSARADKADSKLKLIKAQKPTERWLMLQKEATVLMNDALGCIRGQLRAALKAIDEHAKAVPEENCELFMAGLVGQVQRDVNALREEFALDDLSAAAELQRATEHAQWAGKK